MDREQLVEQPKPYSPYVDHHLPKRVFFGDAHHHTTLPKADISEVTAGSAKLTN